MSDDKSRRNSPDNKRIDVHDGNELRYWSKALNVRPDTLKELVARVGTSASKVRKAAKETQLGRLGSGKDSRLRLRMQAIPLSKAKRALASARTRGESLDPWELVKKLYDEREMSSGVESDCCGVITAFVGSTFNSRLVEKTFDREEADLIGPWMSLAAKSLESAMKRLVPAKAKAHRSATRKRAKRAEGKARSASKRTPAHSESTAQQP